MFSVIIPVHNKLPHLDRSVYSVLNQTFKDFELILIDDASSDGSEEKIKEYQDTRIQCYKRDKPGPGGYAGRNLGIEKAKYEWIAFLDADDEWHEDYLLERIAVIQKYDEVDIISSKHSRQIRPGVQKTNNIANYNEYYTEFRLPDYLNNTGLIWTGSVTMKKELLLKVGMFPDGKCKRGGDLDTWIRSLYKSRQNIFINKSLSIYYRDTVNQVTDHRKNPSKGFCSDKTLNQIRSQSVDKELLKAIDVFIAKHVYNILRRNRKTEPEHRKYLLGLIRSKTLKLNLVFRLSLIGLLIRLKVKK